MQTIKPILFCALTLGILSTTPTDAFARGMPHGHGGDFAAMENRAREIPHADDTSKFHAVLKHPNEPTSGAASEIRKEVEPEVVTVQGSIQGYAHEGVVGEAHPESKIQPKAMVSCYDSPNSTTCK